MQYLDLDIIENTKKEKIKKMEKEISFHEKGEIIICPFCNYIGDKKNKKGSAKIFEDNNNKFLKCFACGIWRKL